MGCVIDCFYDSKRICPENNFNMIETIHQDTP